MQIQLLHNPEAGMANHGKEDLVAGLAAKGADVAYCSTKSDAFPGCLSRSDRPALIAGGDGTVAKVAKHLGNRARPLGILPLGGSNNTANSLGFESNAMLSGQWPGRTTRQAFHLGKLLDADVETDFLEGVGFGALAASMASKAPSANTVREKILNGRRLLADALAEFEAVESQIVIDDQVQMGRWLLAEALTLSHSGPRLPLARTSEGLRGRFSVVLLENDRRRDMIDWLKAPEHDLPPLRVFIGCKISFRVPNGTRFRVDDETITSGGNAVELEIDDDPIHFLIPQEARGEGEHNG